MFPWFHGFPQPLAFGCVLICVLRINLLTYYFQTIPSTKVSHKGQAQSGSWFARDNTANFIHWCRDFGVKAECLFETEGLGRFIQASPVLLNNKIWALYFNDY